MRIHKIPYGVSDYKMIKTDNLLYVDKTRYISKLEELDSKYLIFLRPRGFGKSLLVSTLFYYYDKNSAEEFNDLFADTYIGVNKSDQANQHYVLHFDFSNLSTGGEQTLLEAFYNRVNESLINFIGYYHLEVDINSDKFSDPASLLSLFLTRIYKYTGKKVYVMADGYDDFVCNLIGNHEFIQQISNHDCYVKSFYEVFKAHAGDGCIDRIFITGVTSMALDALASGFNIASDVSMIAELNNIVGFTKEETRNLLEELDVVDIEYIMSLLVEQYDGYLFQYEENQLPRVLNSNLLMYFLKEYQQQGKISEALIDSNIRTNYRKLKGVFALFTDEMARSELLENIMEGKSIATRIVTNITFSSASLSRGELLSMLFYLGFLTIERFDGFDVVLRPPNAVIRCFL